MRSLTVNRSRIPPTVEDSVSFVLSRMLSVVAMWMLTPHLAQAGSGLYVSSEFGVNFTPNLDITGTNSVPAVTNNSTITVPGAPTRLIAAANGQTIINLYWTTPVSNGGSPITGYRIEISPVFNWTTLVADTTSTSTTYSHTGLAAGTTRYYRVSAINANGTGEPSNTAKITTGAPVPGAPTDLSATASGTTQIDLSWTAPDDGGSPIITYGIHVSPDGRTDWRTRAGNPNTTYSQIQLAPGTTRYYRVSAANAHGHSPFSNIASATTDTTGTGTSVPGGGGGGPRQTVPDAPTNVAFLEQAAPNTGPDENGTVQFHSGFASGGAILTAFPNADFTAGGYQVARISLSSSLLLEGSALFVNDGTSFQGNIYDGFELNGAEATFSSFPGEITRVAFLDPDGDLVFVEFGSDDPNTTLTISLQDFAASVPSPYNQPGKTYVQGLATITIENSTAGTYLSVFTLGNDPDRVDTAIISGSTFSGNVDGIADIKSISVESPDGQVTMIGGINAANANFVGLPGVLQFIGINAPDVIVANFLLIGDLTPVGRAAPRIIIDPSSTIQEISVTGGDLREAVGSLRVDTDDGVYPFSFTASSGQRSISDSSLRPDLGDGRLDAATDTFASDVDSYFLTGGQSSGVGQ